VIVGLAGYAGSGKDAAAQALVERGFRQVAFADPIRKISEVVNPVIGKRRGRLVRYDDAIARHGYTEAKRRYPLLREFLQRLGTEGGRDVFGEDVWVELTLGDVDPGEDVVVTDVRFPNEVRAITCHGGVVLRIVRPGVGPANGHASETAIDDFVLLMLVNDGTLDDLHRKLDEFLAPHTA
jgi:hypothetical protein